LDSAPVIKIAFYKGGKSYLHKIVRWWTDSIYSHAELIMPDGVTWITISPFLSSKVVARVKTNLPDATDWDFIELPLSWRPPVREYQIKQLYSFVERTQGSPYDWAGMILSQLGPYIVKRRNRWYCSQWIAYALLYSRVITWSDIRTYNTPDMSPGKLFNLLNNYNPDYS
jgi:hypothetical protein